MADSVGEELFPTFSTIKCHKNLDAAQVLDIVFGHGLDRSSQHVLVLVRNAFWCLRFPAPFVSSDPCICPRASRTMTTTIKFFWLHRLLVLCSWLQTYPHPFCKVLVPTMRCCRIRVCSKPDAKGEKGQ